MTSWFYDLRAHTLQMFFDPEQDIKNEEKIHKVRALIKAVRHALTPPDRETGMWEMMELDYADHMLDSGFFKLALAAVDKAVTAHHLSYDEYAFGFDCAYQQKGSFVNKARITKDSKILHEEEAALLVQTEEDIARHIKSKELVFAAELHKSQQEAASELVSENKIDADALVKAQEKSLNKLKAIEALRLEHQEKQNQILSWITGGYSFENTRPDFSSENVYIVVTGKQKIAALQLKERQDKTAIALKDTQSQVALELKEHRKKEAETLKAGHEETALNKKQALKLKEREKASPDIKK